MFEGFARRRVVIGECDLNVLTGGEGPPLLLLHGYPQTQAMWHRVAPVLAERFSLVIPDLPGYGDSAGRAPDADHVSYSKRATAGVMLRLMAIQGYDRFMLAGHDRGARVSYRLALDHPGAVSRLASLDVVPTLDVWEQMDWQEALATYHWPFLAVPAPLPERLIGGDPDFYLEHLLARWAGRRAALDPEAVAEYKRTFRKAGVIAATCADYRAGAGIDVAHDRADRAAGRRIACPVLVIWGRGYLGGKIDSPLATWRRWADDVREIPLDCGHFVAEEEPVACAAALRDFFSA